MGPFLEPQVLYFPMKTDYPHLADQLQPCALALVPHNLDKWSEVGWIDLFSSSPSLLVPQVCLWAPSTSSWTPVLGSPPTGSCTRRQTPWCTGRLLMVSIAPVSPCLYIANSSTPTMTSPEAALRQNIGKPNTNKNQFSQVGEEQPTSSLVKEHPD